MNFNSIQNNISIARVLWRALSATVLFVIAPLALAQQVLTPTTISFGNVPLTVPVTQTTTFTNNSTFQPVTISALTTTDARFAAVGSGASPCNVGAVVSFGASCTYALTFTPTGTGTYNNTTTVAYNLATTPLTLTQASNGTGYIPPSTALPSSILFGNVPLTVVANQTFTFTNNSNTTLFPASYTLTSFTTTGLGFSAVGSGGTPCAVGLVLPPAASCQGTASFQISGSGSSNGTTTIGFQTGQGSNPTFNTAINLNGVGFVPPSILTPTSISFGNVPVGATVTQTATFTNKSDTTAYPSTYHVDSLAVSGLGYSVAGSGANPCTVGLMLSPGLSCGFTVTFVPAGVGSSGGTVTIGFGATLGTDPPYSQALGMSGNGVTAPIVTISGSGVFPNTAVGGTSAVQNIIITNTGTAPLNFSLTHSNPALFRDTYFGDPRLFSYFWCFIGADTSGAPLATSTSIAPGSTCTLQLVFKPTVAGSNTANLVISSNATPATTTIVLSGTGVVGNAPSTPGTPTAAAQNGYAVVAFAPSSDTGFSTTGYTVLSSPPGGFDSNAGSSLSSHIVTGLNNGAAYTFTVVANNGVGSSAPSPASSPVTPTTPTQPLPAAIPQDGLLAYFPFSTSAINLMGGPTFQLNPANATIIANSLNMTGVFGGSNTSGKLDGVGYQKFSTIIDFKFASLPTNGTILTLGTSYRSIELGLTAAFEPRIKLNNGVTATNFVGPLALNTWHRAIMVVDVSALQITLYINGVQQTPVALPSGFAFDVTYSFSNPGDRNFSFFNYSNNGAFKGDLNNLLVYGRALSSAEALSLNALVPPPGVAAPSITSAAPPGGTVGIAYSHTFAATGSTPISWSTAGPLPAGLALNSTSGVLSGTPTAAGTFSATVNASNAGGTASQAFTITITVAPTITSTAPATGTVGIAYSHTFTATGTSPITWSVATGTLPTGLTLNGTSGVLSGTPTTAGSFGVTIQAANGTAPNATQTNTIVINPAAPVITSPNTAGGVTGSAFTYSITATNSPTSFGATGLPTGLTVNTATGIISGTPTVTGTFAATITATNAGGTGSQALTITITAAPVITSTAPLGGTVGIAYSHTFTATGTTPITWSIATGTLPAGLTLNATSGVLSGSPSVAGTFSATVNAANVGGANSQAFSITITAAAPLVSPTSLTFPSTAQGTESLPQAVTVTNSGTAAMTLSLPTVSLPAFFISATTCGTSLPAMSSCTISTTLRPSPTATTGAISGSLGMTTSTGPVSVALAGTVASYASTVTPAPVPFPTTTVLTNSASQTATFTNSSGGTINIATVDLTGTNAVDFQLLSTTCTGIIASMGTCTATVRFSPQTIGSKFASVRFASGAGAITLGGLTGNAVGAALPPTVSLSLSSSTTTPGNPVTLILNLANPGATSLTAGTFTLAYPVGIVTVATPGISNTCGGTVTSTTGSSTLTASGLTLGPGGSCTIGVGVTGATGGSYVFTFSAGGFSASTGSNTGASSATLTVTALAVPTITFATTPTSIIAGGSTVGTMTITNSNATPLTANPFTFFYLAGLVNAAVPNATSTCRVASITASPGSGSYNQSTSFNIPASGSCTFTSTVTTGTPGTYTGAIPAGLIVTGAGSSAASNSVTLIVTVAPTPAVTLAPASINFGARTVNTTSPPTPVTLTNSGTGPLTISSISGSGNFGFTSTCPISTASVAAAGNCNINITFTPLTVATLSGSVTIASNAPGSPHTIALSGTGTAVPVPGIGITPATLTFAAQTINTTSAAQNVTVTNTGFANLTLGSITVATGFTRVTLSAAVTPPDCGSSLAPGSSCQIGVAFNPTGTGTLNGFISITDNAAGSPHSVTLTGTGTPVPVPVISVNSPIAFGDQIINSTSGVQNLTISNTGTATLTISAITLTGANASSYTLTGQSGCVSIAPAGNCTLSMTFTPTTTGAKSAQVNITSNAQNAANVNSVAVTGNGILAPRSIVSFTLSAVGFGDVIFGGATPNQIVTLTNTGGQALSIPGIAVTGDFIQTNNCGTGLAPLASCTINILFTPLGQGVRFGEFILTTNAPTSPDRIQLSGTGCRWFSQAQSRFFLTSCGS